MDLLTWPREKIETEPLPGPTAVVCLADSSEQLARIKDEANLVARLNVIFNDATENYQQVRSPTLEDAKKILQFVRQHEELPYVMIQCQVGVGRSVAVRAALTQLGGNDPRPLLHKGTYNRKLYRLMLEAAGLPIPAEPLVSINVRVKYPPDRLHLLLLSIERQRYDNWEVVAVTDGPNPGAAQLVRELGDPRIRLIETDKRLGRWGHPYRQLGIDHCRGEFIGLTNDDNYYVPGFIEQMVQALETADVAACNLAHNYTSWSVVQAGSDLGSWLVRASLLRQIPWPSWEFHSDHELMAALRKRAGERIKLVDRPLFFHN